MTGTFKKRTSTFILNDLVIYFAIQKNIPELFGARFHASRGGAARCACRVGHIGDSLALIPAGVMSLHEVVSLWDELSLRPSIASSREVKGKFTTFIRTDTRDSRTVRAVATAADRRSSSFTESR